MLTRSLVSVLVATALLVSIETETILAGQATPSLFDIPPKSAEELQSMVQDLPQIRTRQTTEKRRRVPVPRTAEEMEEDRMLRSKRIAERRDRAKELIKAHQPEPGMIQRMSDEDIRSVYDRATSSDPELQDENNRWLRNGWGWGWGGHATGPGNEIPSFLASSNEYYDEWAQGYRMLGGFIDCDFSGGSGDGDGACSRWMMWAAYVNPNYQGGGRNEYFQYDNDNNGDGRKLPGESEDNNGYYDDADTNNVGSLDCHSPDTEWQLIGVYRQEFYQFIEQISKHLWAIDDYEYVVALAGLAYMTDEDCRQVGDDLYAGVMPYSGGNWEIALYLDEQCLYPDTDSGYTFDDFGYTSDMDLNDGNYYGYYYNNDDTSNTLKGYWESTQEYTLELLNEVYSEYKYCTLCMDYPTYQDGYFIGDSGTDDDDIINQCWKFHSHDSYPCEAECIALGTAQGSILQVDYGYDSYGESWDGSSGSGQSTTFDHYGKGYVNSDSGPSDMDNFKANLYVSFTGILFVANLIAYSVKSRQKGSRSLSSGDKDKALLAGEDLGRSSSSTSRKLSKSMSRSRSFNSKDSHKKKSSKKTPADDSGMKDTFEDNASTPATTVETGKTSTDDYISNAANKVEKGKKIQGSLKKAKKLLKGGSKK